MRRAAPGWRGGRTRARSAAPARAAGQLRCIGRARRGFCTRAARGRPARPQHAARPGGLGRMTGTRQQPPRAREDTGCHGVGRRRAPDRRRVGVRLLRRTHGVRRRARRHAQRLQEDLRAGAVGPAVRRQRRRNHARQGQRTWPGQRGVVTQREHRAPRGSPPAHRHRVGQRLLGDGPGRALRRRQDEQLRARVWPGPQARISADQGGADPARSRGRAAGSKAGLASSPTAAATSSRLCHCDQSPRRAGDAWRQPGAALKT